MCYMYFMMVLVMVSPPNRWYIVTICMCRVFHGYHRYGYGIGIWHTATYRVPVPQCHRYFMGILPPGEHNFYCFETHLFSNLIIFFHHVTLWCNQIWFCQPCVYPCLLPSSSSLLPLLSHNKKPSKLYLYILKTHQLFIFRLIIHVLKLSWIFILLVLTIFDVDADTATATNVNEGEQVTAVAVISSNPLYTHIRLFPISRITLAHLRTQ